MSYHTSSRQISCYSMGQNKGGSSPRNSWRRHWSNWSFRCQRHPGPEPRYNRETGSSSKWGMAWKNNSNNNNNNNNSSQQDEEDDDCFWWSVDDWLFMIDENECEDSSTKDLVFVALSERLLWRLHLTLTHDLPTATKSSELPQR